MKLSCYVYYRVAASHGAEAGQAAQTIVNTLSEQLDITARLLTKVDEPLLWMEVYEDIKDKDAFIDAMEARVKEAGIVRCLAADGRRHIELFQCA